MPKKGVDDRCYRATTGSGSRVAVVETQKTNTKRSGYLEKGPAL